MSRKGGSGPRVAVIVPIFKHATLLSDAIESVLTQNAPFEISLILVNDGCPFPETDDVCRDYAHARPDKVVYLRKPNGGLSDARNHGIEYVLSSLPSVEAIYLLDADNMLRPPALHKALAALHSDPTLGWIYPNIDMFGIERAHDYGGPYSPLLHSALNICEAGSLISRHVFEAGVRFDTSFKQGLEDWDFFLAASAAGFKGQNLEDFGFRYRKRPESMLAEAEREGADIRAAMVKKHKGSFEPKTLVAAEHKDMPRFAIFVPDQNEVLFATDVDSPRQTVSFHRFEKQIWAAHMAPTHHNVPPLFLVVQSKTLNLLRKAGMLHWLLWHMESTLERDAAISAIRLQTAEEDRISFSLSTADPETPVEAHMLMMGPHTLYAVLQDEASDWIDGINAAKPGPNVEGMTLTLPPALSGTDFPEQQFVTSEFLAAIHRLRASAWRPGSLTYYDWREGDLNRRRESHKILRDRVWGAVAYPRLPSDTKQIGMTLPLVEFGGVEKVALNLAREFKAAGYGVHLFVLQSNNCALSEEWREVFDSITFFSGQTFTAWGHGQDTYLGTEVPGWAENGDHTAAIGMLYWLDVVIDFHGGGFVGAMGKLRKFGISTLSSQHLSDLSPMRRPVGNTYLAVAYEHAFDHILTCSHTLADWFHALGVPKDKILPVPNAPAFPVESAMLADMLSKRHNRADDTPLRTLFLGRLDPQKGLERLAQIVRGSKDMDVTWRIVGNAVLDDDAATLSADLSALLEPAVSTADELIALYDWADVVVLVSEYEGLPLTMLEAMRQGAVMLATDVGAVSEVLRHDQNGILLSEDSCVTDCLEALRQLSRDRSHLRFLSHNAATDMQSRTWATALATVLKRLASVSCD